MAPNVWLGSGVVFELGSGDRVVCDGSAAGGVAVLSHAHADHVTGSRAARISDSETGRRYLYTGASAPRTDR